LAKAKEQSLMHIKPRYLYAKAANHLYDHPFQMLISLSVPIIGGLFYHESKKPGEFVCVWMEGGVEKRRASN
jgi:hypothetical protein